MQFGQVIGQVVSTHKQGHVHGLRLFIVQQLDENLKPAGKTITSIDTVNARVDDIVLLCSSSSARITELTKGVCTDNAIVGVVETVSRSKEDWYKR
jgi:microcompartment protein CcmK/EutM